MHESKASWKGSSCIRRIEDDASEEGCMIMDDDEGKAIRR
jgi:hypothetical protein